MFKSKRAHNRQICKPAENTEPDTRVNVKVIEQFRQFAVELETKQDRYERIVKISRDITIESKRLIFYLHTFKKATPDGSRILQAAKKRLADLVANQFKDIMLELSDHDFHQYLRSYSFGVQEFIEAFSFYHYLEHERLLTYEEVTDFLQRLLGPVLREPRTASTINTSDRSGGTNTGTGTGTDTGTGTHGHIDMSTNEDDDIRSPPPPVVAITLRSLPIDSRVDVTSNKNCFVTMMDYVLGVEDLTGELMRYCINQVSSGEINTAFDVSQFMAHLYTGMISVGCNNREFHRKMYTFVQSVKKVEMARYAVQIRGSEIPKHMIINVLEKEENCEEDAHF